MPQKSLGFVFADGKNIMIGFYSIVAIQYCIPFLTAVKGGVCFGGGGGGGSLVVVDG